MKICKCKCLHILERRSFAKGFLNMWNPKFENQKSWIIECRSIFYDVFLSFLELDWCGHYKLLLYAKRCITILQNVNFVFHRKKARAYWFGTTWGWVNDRIIIFWWTILDVLAMLIKSLKKNWQVVNAGYIRPKGERPTMQTAHHLSIGSGREHDRSAGLK